DVYAVTTAISAFFAGLSIGAAVFGRWADRSTRPLRLLAALEGGTAVLALGATLLLTQAAPVFVSLEKASVPLAWLLLFLTIGLPAVLMGGTLPAVLRALAPAGQAVGKTC